MRLVIISGRSGSGKSTALHVLEDMGYNCVDNLPATLLPALVAQMNRGVTADTPQDLKNIAISIDARNHWSDLQQFPDIITSVRSEGVHCEVLFLDANSEILIQRFSETRRKHPLSNENTGLSDAIDAERKRLESIADVSDLVIDTTTLTLHELRDLIKKRVVGKDSPTMAIQFLSFGFKHGVPVDVDLVFDARCLPNPYWKPSLRQHTGLETPVIKFLESEAMVSDMYNDITEYLTRWFPRYEDNNRSYITIAIGCTGGQHRSVYLTKKLHDHFKRIYQNVQMRHRQLQPE